MRPIIILTSLAFLFFFSCNDNEQGSPIVEATPELESNININIDGTEEVISFDCQNTPSIYASGITTDFTTNKLIFDQGFTEIPISADRIFNYKIILYYENDISNLDINQLKEFIRENPETVQIEVSLIEGDLAYKNQFYNLNGLEAMYEERNIVAENEVFNFTLGQTNSFDCLDNLPTLEMKIKYSADLKTKDKLNVIPIDLDMDIHLRKWQ